jgi:hypothetical protein
MRYVPLLLLLPLLLAACTKPAPMDRPVPPPHAEMPIQGGRSTAPTTPATNDSHYDDPFDNTGKVGFGFNMSTGQLEPSIGMGGGLGVGISSGGMTYGGF